MSFLRWCYMETLPPLYSVNAKRNKRQNTYRCSALVVKTNDILDAEADKYLAIESVIDIAKECVRFGGKDAFISSVTVNTRRSSVFISAVNNIFQDKCATHQFHFIDN